MKNKGPIPEGKYYVEPQEVETSATHGFNPRFWGNFRTRLHESWTTALTRKATTERNAGFFLHKDGGGDGTAGCIGVATDDANRTVHGFILTNGSPIPVYVEYLPPSEIKAKGDRQIILDGAETGGRGRMATQEINPS